MISRGQWLAENEELRWFFQDSAADLGMRAQNLEAVYIDRLGGVMPSWRQVLAATRQKRVRRALATLTISQQAILEACYTQRIAPELSVYGAAGGAVQRSLLLSGAEIDALRDLQRGVKGERALVLRQRLNDLREQIAADTLACAIAAHRAYVDVRQQMRRLESEAAERALPAQAVELWRHVERAPSPHKLRVAKVAEMLQEMGWCC